MTEEPENSATTFELRPAGPFAFSASVRFLEGFTPAAQPEGDQASLRIAFPADGTWAGAGACLTPIQDGSGVRVECFGEAPAETVRDQVRRILSLDVDATGYARVIDRDPVLSRISAHMPGLRPVLFFSPYEAAAWAIIGNRIRIVQAAGIKARMALEIGSAVDVGGEVVHAFPTPGVLRDLGSFPGLFGRKIDYLRALGESAEHGLLDVNRLRSQGFDDAKRELMALSGIGPFGAELILLRSVAEVDRIPSAERRFTSAVRQAYGLPSDPDRSHVEEISRGWKPFRTWVSVLLRAALEEPAG